MYIYINYNIGYCDMINLLKYRQLCLTYKTLQTYNNNNSNNINNNNTNYNKDYSSNSNVHMDRMM